MVHDLFQSYSVVMFSRQKLMHLYYAFASYVGHEGHLYEVFLVFNSYNVRRLRAGVKGCSKMRCVLAKSHLILDEMCHLYRKFASYLRCVLFFLA